MPGFLIGRGYPPPAAITGERVWTAARRKAAGACADAERNFAIPYVPPDGAFLSTVGGG